MAHSTPGCQSISRWNGSLMSLPIRKGCENYCVDGYVVNSMTTDETLPLTVERQTVNVLVEGTHRKGGRSVTTVLVMTGTRVVLVLE